MPVNEKYTAQFEFDKTYHIYNKTNNGELLFRSDENHYYFLKHYSQYISPFADAYAWNLQPNHFHFIMRIKPEIEIVHWIQGLEKGTKTEQHFLQDKDINTLVEMTLKRLFTSYAMAFNNMYNRMGNLFYRTFKRIEILKDSQFTHSIVYVHANAQKHQLVPDFVLYPWTSYHSIISDKPTKLLRSEILVWFGGKERLIKIHKDMTDYYYDFPGAIEDGK